MENKDIILSVRNLKTSFHLRNGELKAVDGISYDLERGQVIGIVGESGCGKSISVRSILRLIRKPGESKGEIIFSPKDGAEVDLLKLNPRGDEIRKIRGKNINMVFQEPMNALSPVHKVGDQIVEALTLHTDLNKEQARERAIKLLGDVGIPEPEKRIDAYSFQLSGGMRQRALIAMAISCNPDLLICDEPTTALDVSVQAQILSLMKKLQRKHNMSMIFITHDLAVVAQMVDIVCVMYLGQIVEQAPVKEIFKNPLHPYTKKLMSAILNPSDKRSDMIMNTIKGSVPEPIELPDMCRFSERCDEKNCENCSNKIPELISVGNNHKVRCFKYIQEGEM